MLNTASLLSYGVGTRLAFVENGWPAATMGALVPTSRSVSLSVSQALNVCGGILLVVLTYLGSTMLARLAVLEQRQADAHTASRVVQAWQDRAARDIDADHATLTQLLNDLHEKNAVLKDAIALMRDLKVVIDTLSVKHIEMRENLMRIEQQTKLSGPRK